MARLLLAAPLFATLAACQSAPTLTTGGNPPLSVVGQGLSVQRTPTLPSAFAEPDVRAPNSLWSHGNQGMFRDLRAHHVGDIITVSIDINDKAQFDNASGRSKKGDASGSIGGSLSYGGFGIDTRSGDIAASVNGTGTTSTKGEGTIDRSEKLHLSIAAVVTEVLPGGNLLISGSQEVRVNQEVRVLTLAGIVRPLDIASNNLIAYDKIAEARISYGGRGKLSDVQ
jgi:flagellar L-ring protein precursor FlgH